MEPVSYIAGAVTGLLIALVVAWVERRWAREDVRKAEKRRELEERFLPVLDYAKAISDWVEGVGAWASHWDDHRSIEGAEAYLRMMEEELDTKIDIVLELRPDAIGRFRLPDDELWSRVNQLELLGQDCGELYTRVRDLAHWVVFRQDGMERPLFPAWDGEEIELCRDWRGKAAEHVAYIARLMREALDAVE